MAAYIKLTSKGVFVFRKKVPITLRGILGKGEIKINLKTDNPMVAERQAQWLALKLDGVFSKLTGKPNMEDLEPKEIHSLIKKQLKEWLEDDEDNRVSRRVGEFVERNGDMVDSELCLLDILQAEHTGQLTGQLYVHQDFNPATKQRDFGHTQPIFETVDTMLAEAGIKLSQDSHSYRQLCRQLLRFMIPYYEVLKHRTVGDYDRADDNLGELMGRLGEPAPPVVEELSAEKTPTVSLSELIGRYEKEHQDHKPATMKAYLESYNTFLEIVGDRPVTEMNRDTIIEYREASKRLPKNRNKFLRYRDQSISQLLKMSIPKKDLLHSSTINKHLTRLYTLFDEAISLYQMHPGPNPVIKVKIKSQTLDKDARVTFSQPELKRLFHSSDQYRHDSFLHPYQFWCPLIALFHGLRRREVAQLYVADIQQLEGVWILDLNTNTPDKSLKNKSAPRIVPIHPWLIDEVGFLKFVEAAKSDRLFPELRFTEKEGYGRRLGDWFGKYRDKVGIKKDPQGRKKDFHSLRGNFVTHLVRKQVPWDIRLKVSGHAGPQDETATYFEGYRPAQMLAEVISRVTFHQDLNLDHLKKNRWTGQNLHELS